MALHVRTDMLLQFGDPGSAPSKPADHQPRFCQVTVLGRGRHFAESGRAEENADLPGLKPAVARGCRCSQRQGVCLEVACYNALWALRKLVSRSCWNLGVFVIARSSWTRGSTVILVQVAA